MERGRGVSIRLASHGDLKRILEIAGTTLGAFHRHYVERTFWKAKTFVAERAGALLGFVQFRKFRVGKVTTFAVVYIAVDVAHQRVGVGSSLLKAVEEEAAKQDASVMLATASESNDASKNFFSKHGYVLINFNELKEKYGHRVLFELINLLHAYEDDLLMFKELSKGAVLSLFNELKELRTF